MKNSAEIQNEVVQLLISRFNIAPEICKEENFKKPLTGNIWQMLGTNLAVLYFELEKLFEIRFTEADVQNYGFASLEKIVNLINQKLMIKAS